MAECLLITCDRCHERTTPSRRSRVRWSREPERRPPTDLCDDCREQLVEWLAGPARRPAAPDTTESTPTTTETRP